MYKPILLSALLLTSIPASAQTVIFSDDFESGSLARAFWRAAPGPGGIVDVVSLVQGVEAAESGVYGVAMGRTSAGSPTTNALDLRLDLSAYRNRDVELTFGISDNSDETSNLDGILFSDDGGTSFRKVFDFDPDSWSDGVYGHFPPLDVDALAAANGMQLTSNFVIRFQQHGDRDFSGFSNGIFLDNVAVTAPSVRWANLPFRDDFESGALGRAWSWSDPTKTAPAGTLRPQGFVGVVSTIDGVEAAHSGVYGVAMGRTDAGEATANALDLHLNLRGKTQVQLDFAIRDHFDETNVQDGIWFSDDGGASFKKVFDFDPDLWDHDVWGRLPPLDVDELAAANGLALTNRFVIRFQQYGERDFSGFSDGFLIDDVAVTVPNLVWARMPFRDGFESGRLGNAWAWREPSLTSPPGSLRPQGIAQVVSDVQGVEAAQSGVYGVALGRLTVGGATANALDLHLDLAGRNQAALSFGISDNGDDTSVLDGIWFSDNGGRSFTKVYDFDPSAAQDGLYQDVTLDLDALAREKGLRLTNRFVVRFQQYGDRDFVGFSNGIFLDNVRVAASSNAPSCSGFTVYDPVAGTLIVPDAVAGSSCFSIEMRQIDPDELVFEVTKVVPAN